MSLSACRRKTCRRSAWARVLGLFAAVTLFSALCASAAEEPPAVSAVTPAPASKAVPTAEVAWQSVEVSAFLRDLDRELEATDGAIERTAREFTGGNLEMGDAQSVTLAALERDQHLWYQRQKRALGWMSALTDLAKSLQNASDRLGALHTAWSATREAAQAAQEPASVLREIDRTIAAVEAAKAPLRERRAALLTLLGGIVSETENCGKALDRITHLRDKSVAGAFHPDSPALWSPGSWHRPWNEVAADFRAIHEIGVGTVAEYVWNPSGGFRVDASLFAVFAVIMLAARRWARRQDDASAFESSVAGVFEHPYAAALTLAMLYRTSPLSDVPGMGRGLLQILIIVPAIIIVRPAVPPRAVQGLWALGFLFTADAFRQALAGVPPVGQASLLLENLAGLACAAWLNRQLRAPDGPGALPGLTAMRLLVRMAALAFLVSFAGTVFGYQLLARLLASGILAAGVLAVMLYASLLVLGGLVALALRVWPLRSLRLVQGHREMLVRRAFQLLLAAAILSGTARALDYMGLLIPVADFTGALLGAKLERGTISVTPGDVLVFLVTVYAAHLLSVFLRFVLNEEVYPRTRITAGTSYAASYLLHYVILAVGFMAALGMMGVDFTHVTVLVSAFGVGLGFGLQSVVHNFVSGLILLFERPVHVGDAIETDTIQGEIKRIGIRASVVRTWQGAEVMVPNSQLVSEKVTNWTLSDRHRRIDLPLGISYSANPAAVIALVESVARANPEVVASPPPACFLVGYGDSGVNFELRAWTDQFDNWFRVRGELALAIYEAVQAAPEMSFPFPQREVRVVLDPNTETRNVLVDTLRETADEG